jgi:hypothetical protein
MGELVTEETNTQGTNMQEQVNTSNNNDFDINQDNNANEKGFLDDIKSGLTPADNKAELENEGEGTQKTENSLGEGTAQQEKTDEQKSSAEKNTIKLSNGKEVAVEELAKLYELSSAEGIKLAHEIKKHKELLQEKEKQLLEAELKLEQPPFKILTDEELELLSTKEQVAYHLKLEKWQQEKEVKKAKLEQMKAMEEEQHKKLYEYIVSKSEEMSKDEKKYPQYNKLMNTMEAIIKEAPFITGYKETPDIVYYVALGLKYHKILTEGKTVQEQEMNKQKQEINSKATGISGVGSSAGNKSNNPNEELFDMNYGNSIFK